MDHAIPLSQGGADDFDNLQTLCSGSGGCHSVKTAREAAAARGAPKILEAHRQRTPPRYRFSRVGENTIDITTGDRR